MAILHVAGFQIGCDLKRLEIFADSFSTDFKNTLHIRTVSLYSLSNDKQMVRIDGVIPLHSNFLEELERIETAGIVKIEYDVWDVGLQTAKTFVVENTALFTGRFKYSETNAAEAVLVFRTV